MPQESTAKEKFLLITGLSALVVIWVVVLTWAYSYPLVKADVQKPAPGTDLNLLLAPILAAAAGIERVLESLFDILETRLRTIVAFLARKGEWFGNAQNLLKDARDNYDKYFKAAQGLDPLTNDGKKAQDALNTAEKLVEAAEQRVASLADFIEYKNTKRTLTFVIGLLLGVVVATISGLQMFAALGIKVEAHTDVMLTGLVMGTGSAPVHSLFGILQQGKDTLDGAQGYLKAKSQQVSKTQATSQPQASS